MEKKLKRLKFLRQFVPQLRETTKLSGEGVFEVSHRLRMTLLMESDILKTELEILERWLEAESAKKPVKDLIEKAAKEINFSLEA